MSSTLRVFFMFLIGALGVGFLGHVLASDAPNKDKAAILLAHCMGDPVLLMVREDGSLQQYTATLPVDHRLTHRLEQLPKSARHTVQLTCLNPLPYYEEVHDSHDHTPTPALESHDHAPARF